MKNTNLLIPLLLGTFAGTQNFELANNTSLLLMLFAILELNEEEHHENHHGEHKHAHVIKFEGDSRRDRDCCRDGFCRDSCCRDGCELRGELREVIRHARREERREERFEDCRHCRDCFDDERRRRRDFI